MVLRACYAACGTDVGYGATGEQAQAVPLPAARGLHHVLGSMLLLMSAYAATRGPPAAVAVSGCGSYLPMLLPLHVRVRGMELSPASDVDAEAVRCPTSLCSARY
eukprot:3585596-Rhodomonas_salina.1